MTPQSYDTWVDAENEMARLLAQILAVEDTRSSFGGERRFPDRKCEANRGLTGRRDRPRP